MSAYLLTKTNARASIEWKEDEWLWCEILVQTIVEEAVGIKFFSCPGRSNQRKQTTRKGLLPSGPQRSFRRCMMNTEYATLLGVVTFHNLIRASDALSICWYIIWHL